MTMPSSGPLNMGGTTTPQSVANELSLGLTTTISMNQANVRTLAGVGGSGTTWSMNSLYGKSNRTVAFNNANTFSSSVAGNGCTSTLTFLADGTITATFTVSGGWQPAPTTFISPTGSTTGMSIRCNWTSISRGGSAVVSVFGTTVGAVASYDSGYVSFGGVNKVITGSSPNISSFFTATGVIYITDGTTTISRAFDFFDFQV